MDECVGICEDWDGAVLEEIGDLHSLLHQRFSEGKDALVGLDAVVLYLRVSLEGERSGEGEKVLLLEVILLVALAESWVQLGVQQHNSQPKIP